MKTRLHLVGAVLTTLGIVALSAAPAQAGKTPTKTKMDTPTLSCGSHTGASIEVVVCAGATGAPAGFSLQWMTSDDYALNGGWYLSDDLRLCKASFSGNAFGNYYNLPPGGCTTVNVGDILFDNPGASTNCDIPLVCGTSYVFRSFAHANSTLMRSEFSADQTCSTASCGGGGCTYTQGYWKTHGPIPTGNNSNVWPVTGLTLGTVAYTDLQLQAIFNTPGGGNGLITLAHQLMAAKLNVANGADDAAVAGAIAAADALIGGLVVPPVGAGSLSPSSTESLINTLTAFNEGQIGPGHCP